MKTLDLEFEYRQISSKYLTVDASYQRAVDVNRVKKIVANYSDRLVNPAKVSFRDGKYYVFDGQHTLAALKMRNGNEDLMVDCKIYNGLSRAEEAVLFANQNGISRAVESIAKFKALLAAGDAEIREFTDLTNRTGLKMNFTKGTDKGKIVAVAKAYQIFKGTSSAEYTEILTIIKEAWGGIQESLTREILGGMHLFYRTYKGEFRRDLLVKKLMRVSPVVIVRDGKMFSSGGDMRFAKQLLTIYNKNLRTGALSENRLQERR